MTRLRLFAACLLALLFSQLVLGQTETMGAIKFTPPAGFARSAQEQHAIVFSLLDQAKGSFCFITLYAAAPSSGTPQTDFSSEWKARVVDPWKADANPKTETATENGWTVVAGGAPIEFQGGKSLALLTVISGFGKTVSVFGVLNDDSHLPSLQTFIEKIVIDKTPVARTATPSSAPVPAQLDASGHLIIPPPTRQLTLADIVGQWGESDGINVRYVYRDSGNYAGTDSLHYKSKMTITAEGGYYNDFYAIQNGKMIKDKTAGAVAINGRVISIRQTNVAKYVIRGWLDLPDMTIFEVCGPWYDDDVIPQEIFNNPAQGANLNKKWVRKK